MWYPITSPRDSLWVILYGDRWGEPCVRAGFWSDEFQDWFEGEAMSESLTAFGWQPTHWMHFIEPKE